MEGCFMFQWGRVCFSDGWGFIFKLGGTPWVGGALVFVGGLLKKILRLGGGEGVPPLTPHEE